MAPARGSRVAATAPATNTAKSIRKTQGAPSWRNATPMGEIANPASPASTANFAFAEAKLSSPVVIDGTRAAFPTR